MLDLDQWFDPNSQTGLPLAGGKLEGFSSVAPVRPTYIWGIGPVLIYHHDTGEVWHARSNADGCALELGKVLHSD